MDRLAYGLALAVSLSGCGADDSSANHSDPPGEEAGSDASPDVLPEAPLPDADDPDADDPAAVDAAVDAGPQLEVIEAYPYEGSVVARNQPFHIQFAHEVDRDTLVGEINDQPARLVSPDGELFRFTPIALFEPDAQYTLRIRAGLTDITGAVLHEDWTRSFSTDDSTIDTTGDPAWTSEEEALILSGGPDDPMELVQDFDDSQSMLYAISAPVEVPSSLTDHLVDRMFASMIHHGGIGLAAPQVGISRRAFVAVVQGDSRVFLNPQLSAHAEEQDVYTEGCLSVPFKQVPVLRPIWVEVGYDGIGGAHTPYERIENAGGIGARVWLHEFDHLNGILLLDRWGD